MSVNVLTTDVPSLAKVWCYLHLFPFLIQGKSERTGKIEKLSDCNAKFLNIEFLRMLSILSIASTDF